MNLSNFYGELEPTILVERSVKKPRKMAGSHFKTKNQRVVRGSETTGSFWTSDESGDRSKLRRSLVADWKECGLISLARVWGPGCTRAGLHDQSRASTAILTSAPIHSHSSTLFPSALWPDAPLAGCLWEAFGNRSGWMKWHTGFWADNSTNSSWACCMQVQMQVTHRTSPCFQATKETGRDLSGQHSGLWRQHDQLNLSRT